MSRQLFAMVRDKNRGRGFASSRGAPLRGGGRGGVGFGFGRGRGRGFGRGRGGRIEEEIPLSERRVLPTFRRTRDSLWITSYETLPAFVIDRYLFSFNMFYNSDDPKFWFDCNINPKEEAFNSSIANELLRVGESLDNYYEKLQLAKQIMGLLTEQFPEREIWITAFGSTIEGTGLLNCDLDISLCMDGGSMSSKDYRDIITELQTCLNELPDREFVRVKPFPQRITATLKKKNKNPHDLNSVDVNVYLNTPKVTKMTHLMCSAKIIDARVSILFQAVKIWSTSQKQSRAMMQELHVVPSRALAVMVLHFSCFGVDPPLLPNLELLVEIVDSTGEAGSYFWDSLPKPYDDFESSNKMTVGELLIEFFQYYANFEYETNVISIRSHQVLTKAENIAEMERKIPVHKTFMDFTDVIFIECPFVLDNILSYKKRSKISCAIIRSTFQKSFKRLTDSMNFKSIVD